MGGEGVAIGVQRVVPVAMRTLNGAADRQALDAAHVIAQVAFVVAESGDLGLGRDPGIPESQALTAFLEDLVGAAGHGRAVQATADVGALDRARAGAASRAGIRSAGRLRPR